MKTYTEPRFNIIKNGYPAAYAELINESQLVALYLDYFNNFISVDSFAEYHKLQLDSANFIIDKGREILNRNLTKNK